MKTIENQVFRNSEVIVDDTRFEGCVFDTVKLVFAGKGMPGFVNCQFKDITLQFEGAAANTINFLGGVYGGGMTPAVDKIVDGVRAKQF